MNGAAGKKILLVDDDSALRQSLSEQLRLHEEFDTAEAETAAAGLEMAKADYYDLILLDLGLPDMDGRDVCRLMRRGGVKSPIIMLTAAESDADTILALDAGANDYVTKPFRLGVLLARMRAQLRQHEQSEDAVFTIGPYTFRPSAKLLTHGESKKKVRLTEKETSILKYLYRSGDTVVGRDKLLGEVWGYNAGVTTHTLETHVYRLRQKIESDPSAAEILVTEPGGYRLVP
ncbi:response regulator transcription factor [Pelagibius sp.]|uniref:response regulator transcription factor n=1 Tax=Pelagibius sp. TaxID=1931238 RepID=UPI000AB242B5|nr:response regulator transcription factor [Pelagibius sp.]HIP79858.1 response regulator transcription factor [Kiloniellaceae bacterium]